MAWNEAGRAIIHRPLPLHAREVLSELEAGLAPNLLAERLKPLLDRVASVSRGRRLALAAGCSGLAVFPILGAIAFFVGVSCLANKNPALIALNRGLEELSFVNSIHGLPSGLD